MRYSPLKGSCSTYLFLKGVSHCKLPLGECRGTRGCRSYTVACRVALGHLAIDPTCYECLTINQKTREGCGCRKFLAGRVFRQVLTLLENYSPIFQQHEMLSQPRFGHFPARKMAAGKSAPPSGTLLEFLLRDRHSLLELKDGKGWGTQKG